MKRSSYMIHNETIKLGKKGLKIWAYGRNYKYVCRIEINSTGLACYSGEKGGKRLANATWEKLVDRLSNK